jgi:oxygen-independent coproporphyrinogen-3 oxidase
LRAAGIENINVDLIAGLPHQTAESWKFSVAETIASGVPHISVYMLEVDDDSRLGRELMAGGTRYHAHFVPDDEVTADFYETACERLDKAGVRQYEISNFARPGEESRHNLKYWTRQPYLGFGVDAHSMLASASNSREAVRFASPDALEEYVAGAQPKRTPVPAQAALEEAFFLGLRLNAGVDLKNLVAEFSQSAVHNFAGTISQCVDLGLLECKADVIRLTSRGRLLSNEVFERFILDPVPLWCGTDTPVRRL